jgi:hypothetical protein
MMAKPCGHDFSAWQFRRWSTALKRRGRERLWSYLLRLRAQNDLLAEGAPR